MQRVQYIVCIILSKLLFLSSLLITFLYISKIAFHFTFQIIDMLSMVRQIKIDGKSQDKYLLLLGCCQLNASHNDINCVYNYNNIERDLSHLL